MNVRDTTPEGGDVPTIGGRNGRPALFAVMGRTAVAGGLAYLDPSGGDDAAGERTDFPGAAASSATGIPPTTAQEDVHFASEDGVRLHGWCVEHPQPRAYALFCHGNAEHVGYLGDLLAQLRDGFAITVFAFDYRGYGLSEGDPSEQGVLADGRAARAWLAQHAGIRQDQIVLLSRSLGGAVAVDLAARNGGRGLVLESTFTTLPDLAARHYPWLPVRWLMRSRFDSLAKIARFHGPLLVSHGTADEVAPYDMGQALFAASPARQKRLVADPRRPPQRSPVALVPRGLGRLLGQFAAHAEQRAALRFEAQRRYKGCAVKRRRNKDGTNNGEPAVALAPARRTTDLNPEP